MDEADDTQGEFDDFADFKPASSEDPLAALEAKVQPSGPTQAEILADVILEAPGREAAIKAAQMWIDLHE